MKRVISQMVQLLTIITMGLLAVVSAATLYSRAAPAQAAGGPEGHRLFELRTYTTAEGRLDDLHKRFREHTNKFFKKHGMTMIGYWTPTDESKAKNTLVYMLAFPSAEAREASWKAFRADPEWQRVFTESRKNGRIVTGIDFQLLVPTDYSLIK